jgi:phosphatidate phosphatase APP1
MGDLAASALRWALGLESADEATAIYRSRAKPFVVDNELGKKIVVKLAHRAFTLRESEAHGHFHDLIRISAAEAKALQMPDRPGWVEFRAILPEDDDRTFTGLVQLIPPRGVSVVSDIDDTIKVSEVRDRGALLQNTFVRPFRAVPHMAKVYDRWRTEQAVFHYVSASPWQLYGPLAEFCQTEGFPAGTFHMKQFRVKDSTFFDLFKDQVEYKLGRIRPLLEMYPQRRFLLVGDSGEQDPEIYGQIAREFPNQVVRIYIRDVTDEPADAARYTAAFREVPRDKWLLFDEAQALLPLKLRELAEQPPK